MLWTRNLSLFEIANATLSSFGIDVVSIRVGRRIVTLILYFKGDTIYFARSVTPQAPSTEKPPPYQPGGPKTLNNIMFRDIDGKTLTLHGIPINWRFEQLVVKLAQEKSVNVEELRFIWSGKQLQSRKLYSIRYVI